MENTVELAKRCNLELKFGKYYLPGVSGAGAGTT